MGGKTSHGLKNQGFLFERSLLGGSKIKILAPKSKRGQLYLGVVVKSRSDSTVFRNLSIKREDISRAIRALSCDPLQTVRFGKKLVACLACEKHLPAPDPKYARLIGGGGSDRHVYQPRLFPILKRNQLSPPCPSELFRQFHH